MQKLMQAFVLSAVVICPAHAQKFSDWSAPVSLGAIINSAGDDAGASISQDGRSLYFVSNRPGGLGGLDLYVSRRASLDDIWGAPLHLGPVVNSSSAEQTAWISNDEKRLYFASDRAGGFGGLDLYVTERDDKDNDFGWGPPVNLGSGVNTAAPELMGVILKERLGQEVLYFARGPIGARDLYTGIRGRDGTFGPGVPIEELTGPSDDARMAVRRDALEMLFDSNRPGGLGGLDLWVTTRERAWHPWSPPAPLTVLNSPALDARPALSWDGTTLYFHSGRAGGLGSNDIYVSTRTKLEDNDDEGDD
jgi:hypothetical protein